MAVTDHSGTFTSWGTAQQVLAANSGRTFLLIANRANNGAFYVNLTGTASPGPGSLLVKPGEVLRFDGAAVPTGAVSIYPAAKGDYTVWEG